MISKTWFETWGEEKAQNQLLKKLLILFLLIVVVQGVCLCILALRSTALIGISAQETKLISVTPPSPQLLQLELERTLKEYIKAHYNWQVGKAAEAMNKASHWIHPDFLIAFNESQKMQVAMANEKRIAQKFFVTGIQIDSLNKIALVEGERILLVEGLRASNALRFKLNFEFGPRTNSNPEGIYIAGETLINPTP